MLNKENYENLSKQVSSYEKLIDSLQSQLQEALNLNKKLQTPNHSNDLDSLLQQIDSLSILYFNVR